MLALMQHLLAFLYTIVPVAVLFWSLSRRRQRGVAIPLHSLLVTFISGIVIGVILVLLNAQLMQGKIGILEAARMVYLTISALIVLKLLDRWLLVRVFRLTRVPLYSVGRPISPNSPRALLSLLLQRFVMLIVIVPFAASLLLTYRPKVTIAGDPKSLISAEFASARFNATDGMPLAGWWIPAPPVGKIDRPADAQATARWGRQTVILCHGIGSGKARLLPLARLLIARGYNVFMFDFRAHGESGGNFTSYGDRERYDVLGAVRWIHANHPHECDRIHGVGQNMGAAALLAAAADPHEGQAIDSLVLYEPYSRFEGLAAATAQRTLPWGVRWLVDRLGVPLASLHAGGNLVRFAPIDYADKLWPRPVLVVHGRGQTFVPTLEEMDLYQATPQPKAEFWPADNYADAVALARRQRRSGETRMLADLFREWLGIRESIWTDPGVQHQTFRFLEEEEPLNAI